MLSNKMTVSLMSLITIFALVFAVGGADAAEKPFEIKIMGPTTATYDTVTSAVTVDLMVESALAIPDLVRSDTPADTDNVTVVAIDRRGFVSAATITVTDRPIADYPMRTAKMRQLRVVVTQAADTVDATKGLIEKVIITIPAGLETTDPTVEAAKDGDTKLNVSKRVQHTITLSMAVDRSNLPQVVSIQRLRPGSQTVVSAFQEEKITTDPFDIRIVLTKAHTFDPANAENLVEVENGTASALVVGEPFLRRNGAGAEVRSAADRGQTSYPHPIEGMYQHLEASNLPANTPGRTTDGTDFVPAANSDDWMYRQYRVTITPHQKSADFMIKIRVKEFHDGKSPVRSTYVPPAFGESVNLPNGREILSINVKGAERNLTAGYKLIVKKDVVIPAGGYLILAADEGGSAILVTDDRINDSPRATHRTPAQMLYNVIDGVGMPNLATQFQNGVVVDVQSQHPLVISEVMWGEDVSLSPSSNSQWIELYNPGAQYKTIDDKDETPDVNEALTLVFYGANEFDDIPARDADGDLPMGVTDRIGTLGIDGAYWSPAGKGQNGRSGTGESEAGAGRVAVATTPIVSMYRLIEEGLVATEVGDLLVIGEGIGVPNGQMAASWMSSAGPKSANFDPTASGIRHGTPGAATDATDTPADAEAEAEAEAAKEEAAAEKIRTTGTIPEAGSVYISEIMVAGGGALPQWIEIANGSKTEHVNLSGWTLTIANAAADADVSVGAAATFTIPDGKTIARSGQDKYPSTLLVVTEAGRTNLTGPMATDHMVVLNQRGSTTEVELINAGVTKRKYTLLSDMAFSITLAPPEPEATKPPKDEKTDAKARREADEKKAKAERMAASDTVGNLGADGGTAWALPMAEEGRSSLIRRHVQVSVGPAEPEDGTMAENWMLASDTAFAQPTHIKAQSYYGAMSDVGTPGFRAGGALPVELSQFRPARNKETGEVVITWSTQSELNNAGFFIKRSNQKDGEFKVINAAMIPGAGTTSEKQFYTYTDTTAQPNVVYYYQIEDVSLDGNRQTLTRGIRLKGHVGAAGKATVTWGELKTSNE